MVPQFLVEEQIVKENGSGSSVKVESGARMQLTLGILDAKEQQSVDVGLYISADGETWSAKPVSAFPQKFSVGTWSIFVDLSQQPDTRWIRVGYKLNRWGHWKDKAEFRLYVFAEAV